jgi:hypothetical protein
MSRRWFVLSLCLFVSLPVFGLWKTLKTEAFTVFYPSGREQEAEEILEVLEYYRSYAGDLVGAPTRRVAVVLEDIGNESNGLTDVTFHRILLFRSSPSRGELGYHQNWWRLVGVHEYTHWRHLSAAQGLPAFLTVLFGNTMAPGNYTPGWLKEGICVVAESGTSPYEGRLNEGLFDAYATILAQRGRLPSIVQATYNMDVFPGGTGPYLFGGQFVEFLVLRFGREQVSRFFMHYSSSILSYLSPALPAAGLDRSARKVFGESIRSLWLEWQLELMRTSVSFKRSETALTDHGWWLHSPVFSDGDLYYQRVFPVKPSPFSQNWQHQLLHLDPKSGLSRVLLRSSAPFTGPMRVRSGKLFYALQEIEGGYDNHFYNRFGYTSVLYSRELGAEGQSRGAATRGREPRLTGSRRTRRLLEEPFRTFEVLADGTILTAADREDAFGSVIRLHDPAGGTNEPLLVTDLLVSDIVADARNIFVTARADWSNARIYRISIPGWTGRGESLSRLNPAEIRLEQLHDTPFQEAELCLADGRLFYSATYGAKRTLYEYQIDTGVVYRSVSSDFARSPAWDADSRTLYYVGLNTEGEDLYREKALSRPITVPIEAAPQGVAASSERTTGVPSAGELDIPDAVIRRGGYYDNLASLRPRTLFPVFSLDPYLLTYQAGAGIAGASALGDFQYVALGYYDSDEVRPVVQASLQTNILAPLNATFDLTAAGVPSAVELVEVALTLELPLYQSLKKGFSYFSLGTMGVLEWESGDKRRQLTPFSLLVFQGASSSFGIRIRLPWAYVEDWTGSSTQYALNPLLFASLVFLGAEVSIEAMGVYDLEGLVNWDLPTVPGYSAGLSTSWGGFIFSNLSIPLLRLRGGLWNPGLYFGDMFFVPFLSLAFNQDQQLQLSYGGAFHLELKAGARDEGFPIDLYAGLGMTREGRPLVLLGFEIYGYGGGFARGNTGGVTPQPVPRR